MSQCAHWLGMTNFDVCQGIEKELRHPFAAAPFWYLPAAGRTAAAVARFGIFQSIIGYALSRRNDGDVAACNEFEFLIIEHFHFYDLLFNLYFDLVFIVLSLKDSLRITHRLSQKTHTPHGTSFHGSLCQTDGLQESSFPAFSLHNLAQVKNAAQLMRNRSIFFVPNVKFA